MRTLPGRGGSSPGPSRTRTRANFHAVTASEGVA
jgi:hypothetical protein